MERQMPRKERRGMGQGSEHTGRLLSRGALLLGQEKDREAWRGERFLRSPEGPLALGQRCGHGKRERKCPSDGVWYLIPWHACFLRANLCQI